MLDGLLHNDNCVRNGQCYICFINKHIDYNFNNEFESKLKIVCIGGKKYDISHEIVWYMNQLVHKCYVKDFVLNSKCTRNQSYVMLYIKYY